MMVSKSAGRIGKRRGPEPLARRLLDLASVSEVASQKRQGRLAKGF